MSPTPKTDDSAQPCAQPCNQDVCADRGECVRPYVEAPAQPELHDDEYRAALVKEARDYALRTPDVLAARAINTLATEIERMSLAEGE